MRAVHPSRTRVVVAFAATSVATTIALCVDVRDARA
jgi:hypothetical protein